MPRNSITHKLINSKTQPYDNKTIIGILGKQDRKNQ